MDFREKKPEPLTEKDKLAFGKYRGSTIGWVLENDPAYLLWCMDNVNGFDLHVDTYDRLVDYLYPPDDFDPYLDELDKMKS